MKGRTLRTRQRGVTLVIAMIMLVLVLVSLLAAAAYLMSTGEARGATGWSDRQRAIFLAENALKTAESAVATLVAGKPDVANLIAAQGTAAGYYLRANGNVPTLNPWPSSGTVEVSTPIEGKTATAHYLVIYEGRAPAFGERLPSTRSLRSRFTLIAQAGGLKPETNVVLSVSREY